MSLEIEWKRCTVDIDVDMVYSVHRASPMTPAAQDCPWRMWSKMGWSLRRSEGKRWWMNHENAMEIYWNICGHGKTSIIPSYHILCILILQYPPIISGWMIRTYNDQASIRYLRNLANHPNILPRSEWGYIRALEPPCYIWMWSGQSMMIHSFEMGEFQANIKMIPPYSPY